MQLKAASGGGRSGKELVRHADVVTENFSVGTMERLGLGYEALRAVKPDLVYASITAFGQHGPYADQRGYDMLAQAISGYMSITGLPDGPTTRSGQSISDYYAGMLCAYSLVSVPGGGGCPKFRHGRERGGGSEEAVYVVYALRAPSPARTRCPGSSMAAWPLLIRKTRDVLFSADHDFTTPHGEIYGRRLRSVGIRISTSSTTARRRSAVASNRTPRCCMLAVPPTLRSSPTILATFRRERSRPS